MTAALAAARPRQGLRRAHRGRRASISTSTRGEILGLLGPNGAGKTTTISMACGVVTPTPRHASRSPASTLATRPLAAKRKLGLVPQDLALYEELSAQPEPARSSARSTACAARELAARIDWALGVVGLADRATRAGQEVLRRHEAAAQPRRRPGPRARAARSSTSRPSASIRRAATTSSRPCERCARDGHDGRSTRATTWKRSRRCAIASRSWTAARSSRSARSPSWSRSTAGTASSSSSPATLDAAMARRRGARRRSSATVAVLRVAPTGRARAGDRRDRGRRRDDRAASSRARRTSRPRSSRSPAARCATTS